MEPTDTPTALSAEPTSSASQRTYLLSPSRKQKVGRFLYPVGVLLLVIISVVVVSFHLNWTSPTGPQPPTYPRSNDNIAPQFFAQEAANNVDISLLEVTNAYQNVDGATIEATTTPLADSSPSALAGEISRVLADNCVDNLSITNPAGFRFQAWGFCHTTTDAAIIEQLLNHAYSSQALRVSIQDYRAWGHQEAKIFWETSNQTRYDELIRYIDSLKDEPIWQAFGNINLRVAGAGDLVENYYTINLIPRLGATEWTSSSN